MAHLVVEGIAYKQCAFFIAFRPLHHMAESAIQALVCYVHELQKHLQGNHKDRRANRDVGCTFS